MNDNYNSPTRRNTDPIEISWFVFDTHEIFSKLKHSHIEYNILLLITAAVIETKFDLTCSAFLQRLVNIILIGNTVWLPLNFAFSLINLEHVHANIIVILGYCIWIIYALGMYIMAIVLWILSKGEVKLECYSDQVMEMYAIWIVVAITSIFVQMGFKKWIKRKKRHSLQELVLRGTHNSNNGSFNSPS